MWLAAVVLHKTLLPAITAEVLLQNSTKPIRVTTGYHDTERPALTSQWHRNSSTTVSYEPSYRNGFARVLQRSICCIARGTQIFRFLYDVRVLEIWWHPFRCSCETYQTFKKKSEQKNETMAADFLAIYFAALTVLPHVGCFASILRSPIRWGSLTGKTHAAYLYGAICRVLPRV